MDTKAQTITQLVFFPDSHNKKADHAPNTATYSSCQTMFLPFYTYPYFPENNAESSNSLPYNDTFQNLQNSTPLTLKRFLGSPIITTSPFH